MKQIARHAGLNWSGDESIHLLKKIVTVNPRRGTDFMDITVKHAPREEAVRIANAIAEIGSKRAQEAGKLRAQNALEALDAELRAQEELVNAHLSDLVTPQKSLGFQVHEEGQPFPDTEVAAPTDVHDPVGSSVRQNAFDRLIEDYTQARNMLREMKIKQKEARVLLKMPYEPITVHQRAD